MIPDLNKNITTTLLATKTSELYAQLIYALNWNKLNPLEDANILHVRVLPDILLQYVRTCPWNPGKRLLYDSVASICRCPSSQFSFFIFFTSQFQRLLTDACLPAGSANLKYNRSNSST